MARGRTGRRAALRAALAAALAGVATAPSPARRHRRSAMGVAMVAGAAQELPPAAGAAGAAGALAAAAGGAGSARRPGGAGAAIGVAAAAATRRLWPVAPREPAEMRPVRTPVGGEASEDGEGLTVVLNPSAGPAFRRSPRAQLEAALPRATFVEVGEGSDLEAALAEAAASARAIGVAGGDGSVGAAAAVARRSGKPLVVIPSGTLNHLARDLGIDSTDDAIAAVREGDLVALDVATIDGRPFLNTASFGVYSDLVDERERLEGSIGKWPALVVALVRVLRRAEPVDVEIDGRRRRLWMAFVGNCRYHPAGFAPSWRERLDDGLLDVRLVDGDRPWARTRLLAAVLTGRLGRSLVYEASTVTRLEVRSVSGPMRLARDGETFDGPEQFTIAKDDAPLAVYVRS